MSPKKIYTSQEKTDLILSALEERKAVDPVVIDVHARTVMTESMIIATGTSNIHVRSLADSVIEKMSKNGMKNKRVAGYEDATWVLVDYGDVVVHVQSQEQRDRYRLEAYWSGAEKGSPAVLSPDDRPTGVSPLEPIEEEYEIEYVMDESGDDTVEE